MFHYSQPYEQYSFCFCSNYETVGGIQAPLSKPSTITLTLPSQQPYVLSIVAACAKDIMMSFQCQTHSVSLSLGVDTGASVTLLSESAFSALKIKCPNIPLALQSSKVTLPSAQGLNLTALGTLTLLVTLAPNLVAFNVQFYVIKEFVMPCDGLLGFDSLVLHNIDIFPKRHAISRQECFHPAMTVFVPLLSVASLAASLDSTSTLSPVKGNSSPSTPRPVAAVLIGDQYIGPCSAARLPVRVREASVGSSVLSLPDSMKVSRLSLDSTLSSVDVHHVTHALVTNTSGAPITLKQGVLLGTFEMFDPSSLESSPLSVAGVSTQLDEDLSVVVAQLSPHVKTLDYPEGKSALPKLLAKHRHAVALPGEPLGLTNRLTHHIALQPDAKPSFVPSY